MILQLSSLTIPQLKAAATEKGISLGGAKKKDEIVNAIENYYGV